MNDNNSRGAKYTQFFLCFLVLMSVVSIAISSSPGVPAYVIELLQIFDVVCVTFFGLEYILRIYVAKRKWRFIFSFFGLVDLAAILIYLVSLGSLDMRVIRLLRLAQLLRMTKYDVILKRYWRVCKLLGPELVFFFCSSFLLVLIAAVGIYFCEKDVQPEIFTSVLTSLWWAVTTLSSVGYGDMYPVTAGGRLFASFVILIGIGVFAAPAGMIASALIQDKATPGEGKVN
ncbi:MAG: ion transporter [Desulfotalea sp.]